MNEGTRKTAPLPAEQLNELRALIATKGEREALRRTELSRVALLRCAAGYAVYPGTRALVARALDAARWSRVA